MRLLTLDVASRVARIGQAEPHTRGASRGASEPRLSSESVAVAEGGCGGEVRSLGEFPATVQGSRHQALVAEGLSNRQRPYPVGPPSVSSPARRSLARFDPSRRFVFTRSPGFLGISAETEHHRNDLLALAPEIIMRSQARARERSPIASCRS